MIPWPAHPVIYEINTWVWLAELGRKHDQTVTLGTVPHEEWDAIGSFGFDAVWFMGVWERSPMGIAIANRNAGLLDDFRRALPDFQPDDNGGSPYCIRRYVVDDHLGGPEGLAIARKELASRGLRLMLDFVPNHVAPDHPWVLSHPEVFIHGTEEDARREPASFLPVGGTVIACGRDPYFPAWPDVLQLNAFNSGLRHAALETVLDIAGQCDGIRCDMAMLMMNDVFKWTWGTRAGDQPEDDYWSSLIAKVRERHPAFRFVAEAYWDLEWALQQQGFDFCYDKKLYDRMEHGDAESVRQHLMADMGYQNRLIRFIENHDEPRAAEAFPNKKQHAAAVIIATIPGAKLFHEGQFEGRKVRLPVFLSRQPIEPPDRNLEVFYHALIKAVGVNDIRMREWQLCEQSGWPDNQSFRNLLAWCWIGDGEYCLIIVNFSHTGAQGRVAMPWDALRGKTWQLRDALSGVTYERNGDEMRDAGLYVDLGAWQSHIFRLRPI